MHSELYSSSQAPTLTINMDSTLDQISVHEEYHSECKLHNNEVLDNIITEAIPGIWTAPVRNLDHSTCIIQFESIQPGNNRGALT